MKQITHEARKVTDTINQRNWMISINYSNHINYTYYLKIGFNFSKNI